MQIDPGRNLPTRASKFSVLLATCFRDLACNESIKVRAMETSEKMVLVAWISVVLLVRLSALSVMIGFALHMSPLTLNATLQTSLVQNP